MSPLKINQGLQLSSRKKGNNLIMLDNNYYCRHDLKEIVESKEKTVNEWCTNILQNIIHTHTT